MNLIPNFEGVNYKLANEWFPYVPLEEIKNTPIKYLEIGTFYGANAISVANSYCQHPDSKIYCIDPWEDYDGYPEYKGQQDIHFQKFMKNVENSGSKEKFIIHRSYSYNVLSKYPDEFFDMIYIDGNHEPEYVMEDAVLSLRKLKKGGYLLFDDYMDCWWKVKNAINIFYDLNRKRLEVLGVTDAQVYFRKNISY